MDIKWLDILHIQGDVNVWENIVGTTERNTNSLSF